MFNLLLFSTVVVVLSEWKLIESQFTENDFTNTNGWTPTGATTYCLPTWLKLVTLDRNKQQMTKVVSDLPSHWQLKLLVDLYYRDTFDNEYGSVKIDGVEKFTKTYIIQTQEKIENICTQYLLGLFTTNIVIAHQSSTVSIVMQTNLDELYGNENFSFRDVYLYVNLCNLYCKTCALSSDQCTTCYDGIPDASNSCQCPGLQVMVPYIGCQDLCPRDQIENVNHICLVNPILKQHIDYLETVTFTDTPLEFIKDDLEQQSMLRYLQCPNDVKTYLGQFYENEGIKSTNVFPEGTISIRLRALVGLTNDMNLMIMIDDKVISYFNIAGQQHIQSKIKIIQQGTIVCEPTLKMMQIELMIELNQLQTTLQIQGNTLIYYPKPFWIIRDISIDIITCVENCKECKSSDQCEVCSTGYLFSQGQCVLTCPAGTTKVSQICQQYGYNVLYTTEHIARLFFDSQTSDEEAENAFDVDTTQSNTCNFLKGPKYTYIDSRRVFGGSQTWVSAKFKKIYTITQPHYAVGVRAMLIKGDGYPGDFKYKLGLEAEQTAAPIYSVQLQGESTLERVFFLDQQITTKEPTFEVSFSCVGTCGSNRFCAISHYEVIVYNCTPLCLDCTGPNEADCNSWNSNVNITNDHSCKLGYYYKNQDCQQCVQNSCEICFNNGYDCSQCKDGYELVSYTCKCSGTQIETTLGQCESCHNQCQTCIGVSINSCLSCYSESQHRFFYQNRCLCYLYYYDDNIHDECQPCYFLCKKCNGQNNGQCTKCKYNQVSNNHCYCERSNQYIAQKQCLECHPSCNRCTAGLRNECLDCFTEVNRYYSDSQCLCKYGFYEANETDSHCTQCLVKDVALIPACHSHCGDGILQYWSETCDDANDIPFDGCYLCRPSNCYHLCQGCFGTLQIHCLNCFIGTFRQLIQSECKCIEGYYQVDINDMYCTECKLNDIGRVPECYSICGDGIVQWNEQCDDGNESMNDGCYNCEYQCSPECLLCVAGQCLECPDGTFPGGFHFCHSICGDGIVALFEQCEDLNEIQYDGCYECQYQCAKFCNDCNLGICKECQDGYDLINEKCIKCGDGVMLAEYKQCDDGNDISRDGCTKCKIDQNYFCISQELQSSYCYQCTQNCIKCELQINEKVCTECIVGYFIANNQCVKCGERCISCANTANNCTLCRDGCKLCEDTPGYYTNLSKTGCNSKCGDNILVIGEECDDGNLINGDGCNNQCSIEKGTVCKKDVKPQQCFQLDVCKMSVAYITQHNSQTQEIQVTFDLQLQQLDLQQVTIVPTLLDVNQSIYSIEVNSTILPDNQFQDIDLRVFITIHSNLQEPVLNIQLIDSAYRDQYDRMIVGQNKQIRLNSILVLSETEQVTISKIFDFDEALLYFLIVLLVFCFLSGDLTIIWSQLDLLQQLSYMKYINSECPSMIRQLYELFDVVSLSFFQQFHSSESTQSDSTGGKFQYYGWTTNFSQNIASISLIFIGSYCNYLAIKLLLQLVKTYSLLDKCPKSMIKITQQTFIQLVRFNNAWYYSGLMILFTSGIYKVLSATIVQLQYSNPVSILDIIYYYSALTILTVYLVLTYYQIIFQLEALKGNKQITQIVNLMRQPFWAQQYHSIVLIKKTLFMCSLVTLQSVPIMQILMILLNSQIFVLYMVLVLPLKLRLKNIQIIGAEIIIQFLTLSFVVYSPQLTLISLESKQILAWCNLGSLMLLILSNALLDLQMVLPNMKKQTYKLLKSLYNSIKSLVSQ